MKKFISCAIPSAVKTHRKKRVMCTLCCRTPSSWSNSRVQKLVSNVAKKIFRTRRSNCNKDECFTRSSEYLNIGRRHPSGVPSPRSLSQPLERMEIACLRVPKPFRPVSPSHVLRDTPRWARNSCFDNAHL
jgi:hypothetical protein